MRIGSVCGEQAAEEWVGALGQEQHHGDQQRAVHDEMGAVQAALAEVVARYLGQRGEDERAEDRADQCAGPADDRADDDLHRERDAKHRRGLEREEIERVERAAEPGEERRHQHRQHLVLEGVHAQRLAGRLVLADRAEVHPEAPPLDDGGDAGGQEHEPQRQIVVGARVLELELAWIAREGDVEPQRAPHRIDVRYENAAHLGEGHGQQHEVEAAEAEPEAQVADQRAQDGGQRGAHEHPQPRGETELVRQQGRGVAADAHERRVAGRELTRRSRPPRSRPGRGSRRRR